jgi:hypothetical protein
MRCPIASDSVAPLLDIHFGAGSAVVDRRERATLEAFVVSWHGQPKAPNVRIDGFASVDGPEPRNWALSCARAIAVKDVLTSGTRRGVPGIPAAQVDVKADGETDQFGATARDNRIATLWTETPVAPARPTPAFRCGPDVSSELSRAVARTRSAFAGWSRTEREGHCAALTSYRTGGYAWDVVELHNNAWILLYRPACATIGATPPCGSTVQVGTDCHYAGSPNYVIFGTMCDLCHAHYVAAGDASGQRDFTKANMLSLVDLYKGPGAFGSPASGNYAASRAWANAGYDGWPSVASPTGDRPGCDPSCPTPHVDPAFHVAWWQNPGLLSTPTRTII